MCQTIHSHMRREGRGREEAFILVAVAEAVSKRLVHWVQAERERERRSSEKRDGRGERKENLWMLSTPLTQTAKILSRPTST